MEETDKILLKIRIRAKKEAIKDLLKENKENKKIVSKLTKMFRELPANV